MRLPIDVAREVAVRAPQPGFDQLSLAIGEAGLIPPDGRGAYVRAREAEDSAPD